MENKNIDIKDRKLYGILAYLGILIIIPFLVARDDTFVKFHLKQGLLILIGSIFIFFMANFFFYISILRTIYYVSSLLIFILIIIGIINVINEEEKELPLIGHFAKKFNI